MVQLFRLGGDDGGDADVRDADDDEVEEEDGLDFGDTAGLFGWWWWWLG